MPSKGKPSNNPIVAAKPSRAIKYTSSGVKTSKDFANTMSALMGDLLDGSISPQVGNAVCNAGGKLLKVIEMNWKYGSGKGSNRIFQLAN